MFFAPTREHGISFATVVPFRHRPVAQNRLFFSSCLPLSREKRVAGVVVRLYVARLLPTICAFTGRERLPSLRLPVHPVASHGKNFKNRHFPVGKHATAFI